jgi:hypothetical protein
MTLAGVLVNREQVDRRRDSLQRMGAAVGEAQGWSRDEVADRARHEHLVGLRERGDRRRDVDRDAGDVARLDPSISPVWTPARSSRSSERTAAAMLVAQRTARAGRRRSP